ncbi:hypothetical protein MMC27_008451 [Xylographa pallens]|nr:hypothetical protein [Xylographa pallens]
MVLFHSHLPDVATPSQDVFDYIFSRRRDYPPDRVLYRADASGETLTVTQLEEKSRRFAHVLVTQYSIIPEDVVAILASDTLEYPIAYFGILAAGATVQLIPIQAGITAGDIFARVRQAETKLLVTDTSSLELAGKVSRQSSRLPLLVLDGSYLQLEDVHGVKTRHEGFKLRCTAESESHVAFVNRTSGSTGNMKTVLTTHAHFIAVLESTLHTIPANTDPDRDVWLSSLSLGFFINAKLHMGLNILLGIPVVLMNGPFGERSLSLIERYRITFLFIPPPVAAKIAKADRQADFSDVSSIKWLLSAGAPMHEGLQLAISQKFNGIHLDLEWGTSETLLIAIQMDGNVSPQGSSGVLVNSVEAKVVDVETGEELEAYEKGEILVRNSACRFRGYKGNEAANQAAFDEDGWYHSGDFGYLDSRCNVFIMDRLKELIRVGGGYGVHISATELEAVLFAHPAVAQVVVTGCYDAATASDHPTAFVVLKAHYMEDRSAALKDIEKWAGERLQGMQRLSGGVVFVPKFPLVGFKIDRRTLKGLANVERVGLTTPRYVEIS